MSLDQATISNLRSRLDEVRQGAVELIVTGKCEDHSTYRYSAGYIKALDDVQEIIEEITSDLRKG